MVSTAFPNTDTSSTIQDNTPVGDLPQFDSGAAVSAGYDFQPGTDIPAPAPEPETPAPPADPFATLPDEVKQQLTAAEARARAAEEAANAVKAKTDAWEQQIAEARQQQEGQQLASALEAWEQKLNDGTLSAQEIAQTRALVERGVMASKLVPMGNGVFVSSQDTIKQYAAFDAAAAQSDLRNHAWDTLLEAYPPQTSLATLRAKHRELMGLAPQGLQSSDPRLPMVKDWMARQAKAAAGAQYEANRRDNVPRERVEGGGQGVGGASADAVWAAYGRGEIAWGPRVQAAGRELGVL